MRLVGMPPLELVEAYLYVKRVNIVLVFVSHKFLVYRFGVVQLIASFHLHKPRGLKELFPPAWAVLLDEIALEYIHLLIGWRQVEGVNKRWVGDLLRREFNRENFGANA